MATDDNATTERTELDPIFKEILTFSFGQLALPIETQVEVSRLPRTMDALVVLTQQGDLEKARRHTVFNYFRTHNQIEYKGKTDSLTRDGYHLIRGRSHLYLGEKKISSAEMTVTIISARRPRTVLYHCQDDVEWEALGGGHYVSADLPPTHLFVCSELEVDPGNYSLLLFAASKRKFRQFVEQIVSEDNTVYINYALRIEPSVTEEVLKMAGKQSLYEKHLQRIADSLGKDLIPLLLTEDALKMASKQSLYEKHLQRIADSLGEDLIPLLNKDEMLKQMTLSERLHGLSEDDLRTLNPETKEMLKKVMESLDEEQN